MMNDETPVLSSRSKRKAKKRKAMITVELAAVMNDGKTIRQPGESASMDEARAQKLAEKPEGPKAFDKKRLFTHPVFLVCAGLAALSFDSAFAGLCVYTGGICFFLVVGVDLNRTWIAPAAVGAMQTLHMIVIGVSPYEALFWGGFQSYLQSLSYKKLGTNDREANVCLLTLLIAVYLLFTSPLIPIAVSFISFFFFGAFIAVMLAKQKARPEKLETLGEQGPPPPEKVRTHQTEKIQIYHKLLEEFKGKIKELTEPERSSALSIAESVDDILDSMANDERDTEPGHRFLNRYFKAAYSVVEKHLVLAKKTRISRETVQALDKSRETLLRLSEAFAKEQAKLHKNDVTDFSADLAAIDTLLKMDGF